MLTMAQHKVEVTGGVDTHKDTHTAAAIDAAGRVLGSGQFPATVAGYRDLLGWLGGFGTLVRVGVEGTGVYGAGLVRHLHAEGIDVVEIDRPARKTRRWQGKSSPTRSTPRPPPGPRWRSDAPVSPSSATGRSRRCATCGWPGDARSGTAPTCSDACTPWWSPPQKRCGQGCADCPSAAWSRCAPLPDLTKIADPEVAAKVALRQMARRHLTLTVEIVEADALIAPLVTALNPTLLALNGVGADVAGQLLVTAGQNPERLHSEAAFAMLCGVAPLPASSGKTHRHRLNRGGDRQANAALYRIVLCRLRWDQQTKDYLDRRTKQGLSKPEVIRCLKRFIAREIYRVLQPKATEESIAKAA